MHAFTPQPQSITALWLVLISCPTEDRRLSWSGKAVFTGGADRHPCRGAVIDKDVTVIFCLQNAADGSGQQHVRPVNTARVPSLTTPAVIDVINDEKINKKYVYKRVFT